MASGSGNSRGQTGRNVFQVDPSEWSQQQRENAEATGRALTPGGRQQTPVSYQDPSVDGATAVNSLFFREIVDVLYNPKPCHRKLHHEWPTADEEVLKIILPDLPPINQPVSSLGKEVVEEELDLCDDNQPLPSDHAMADVRYYRTGIPYHDVLRGLYYRGRRQSVVWDVFMTLVARDLIDPVCLRLPFDIIGKSSPSADALFLLLYHFSRPQRDIKNYYKLPMHSGGGWDFDLRWLATMIVRGGRNLFELLETIASTQFLGTIDLAEEAISRARTSSVFKWDPKDQLGTHDSNGNPPKRHNTYGFWLPSGVTSAEALRACINRFNKLERAFRTEFHLNQRQVLLESEQMDFYERNPELCPDSPNDHFDEVVTLNLGH